MGRWWQKELLGYFLATLLFTPLEPNYQYPVTSQPLVFEYATPEHGGPGFFSLPKVEYGAFITQNKKVFRYKAGRREELLHATSFHSHLLLDASSNGNCTWAGQSNHRTMEWYHGSEQDSCVQGADLYSLTLQIGYVTDFLCYLLWLVSSCEKCLRSCILYFQPRKCFFNTVMPYLSLLSPWVLLLVLLRKGRQHGWKECHICNSSADFEYLYAWMWAILIFGGLHSVLIQIFAGMLVY